MFMHLGSDAASAAAAAAGAAAARSPAAALQLSPQEFIFCGMQNAGRQSAAAPGFEAILMQQQQHMLQQQRMQQQMLEEQQLADLWQLQQLEQQQQLLQLLAPCAAAAACSNGLCGECSSCVDAAINSLGEELLVVEHVSGQDRNNQSRGGQAVMALLCDGQNLGQNPGRDQSPGSGSYLLLPPTAADAASGFRPDLERHLLGFADLDQCGPQQQQQQHFLEPFPSLDSTTSSSSSLTEQQLQQMLEEELAGPAMLADQQQRLSLQQQVLQMLLLRHSWLQQRVQLQKCNLLQPQNSAAKGVTYAAAGAATGAGGAADTLGFAARFGGAVAAQGGDRRGVQGFGPGFGGAAGVQGFAGGAVQGVAGPGAQGFFCREWGFCAPQSPCEAASDGKAAREHAGHDFAGAAHANVSVILRARRFV
jgi:hypothetical protein